MAEDLRVKTLPNGTAMVEKKPVSAVGNYWKGKNLNGDEICLYPWRTAANRSTAYQSEDPLRGICPEGWHLPSFTEWATMFKEVDPECDPGVVHTSSSNCTRTVNTTGKLGIKLASPDGKWVFYPNKEGTGNATYSCPTPETPEAGATYQNVANTPGYTYPDYSDPDMNASGFCAMPNGYVSRNSPYDYFHNGSVHYWVNRSRSERQSQYIRINYNLTGFYYYQYSSNGNDYQSVRCLSDETFGE